MSRTLLQDFIKDRLASYVEPQRVGTPKGEPVGASREKYHASLEMLTNAKLKDIAKKLKISYGLIMKWRTEMAFKDLLEKNYPDAADLIVKYMLQRIKKNEPFTGLVDNEDYHDKLIDAIFHRLTWFVNSGGYSHHTCAFYMGKRFKGEIAKSMVQLKNRLHVRGADIALAATKDSERAKFFKTLIALNSGLFPHEELIWGAASGD